MNFITTFLGILILWTSTSFAQNKEFGDFANLHDSLMRKAYNERNPKNYLLSLNNFNDEYSKLSNKDKDYFKGNRINAFYNLSCIYSLSNDKINAIDYLKKSIEAGYNDYSHIQQDSDLDNIRKEEAFLKLVQSFRDTGDFLYILKKAGKYNLQEKQDIPFFAYQSANNPNLVTLRKTFNLDSVAGNAGEVSKILNLLHWVHNLIPHDGSHENPVVKNAISMIRECKRDARGLNCRGLATVLNECYLSMGIKSRFVTCIPKDSLGTDTDCHVINIVYSTELKKWLWIDPTNNAYVMNEQGELLSIEEVRERLINDKPLLLNPEANWNNKSAVVKRDYLYTYMAKNLYILECPVSSEYDTETKETGKTITYVRLIPLDYFKKSLEKGVSTNNNTKTTLVTYRTNNPNVFWQTP